MPYKGGVQLLPETQRRPTLRSYTSGNSYFYFAVFLGALILVFSAVMGGYKARLVERINELDGTMETSEKARSKDAERELIAAAKQAKIMKQLVDSKLYWSQALDRIEQMLQTSVVITSLEGDAAKGTVAFRAIADSYASVARQIAAFVAATGVNDVQIGKITTGTIGVEFDGELTVDRKALLMKAGPTPTPKAAVTPTPTP
jgi:Tfp pilus assembly protein PilN